jgi:hypothetical protein
MQTYELGKGTALNILQKHGVKMRGQGISEDRLDQATSLYTSGLSLKQIATQFDCSAETVRKALIRAGIQMRACWERGATT